MKQIVAEPNTWLEGVAIVEGINNLNKKLGKKQKASLKRKGVKFQVWN